ncbi:hypothetical protein AWB81_07817 [Caballeronia arationis]|uniref:DUF1173 family protein n=1 Tax=Caballeronia arationis TaxID=1777142 RepID=UPI00074CB8EA|nr:DUF1173 family protein [Caballeronia arationis]SAL06908.1 hypothetical protein AWB81_07817 [Caballeronia arationis]
MTLVSFDGITVALTEVQDNPAKYARALERAKKVPGHAVCRCLPESPRAPLRLVIRRYGALFHLARWPDDGHRHNAKTCSFYRAVSQPDRSSSDTLAAIRTIAGGLDVKLSTSLSVRTVGQSTRQSSDQTSSGTSRRPAPLLGFLQRVWEDAGLNEWAGAPSRGWGACNAQLLSVLGDGKLNGKSMQDVLHVMRRYDDADSSSVLAEFQSFLDRIVTTPARSNRGLLIAELRSVEPSRYGFVVRLRQTRETFFASKAVIDSAADSFRSAWAMIGDACARVVTLAVIERTKEGNLRIVDCALQLCNSTFLPCDSSFEVAMANRLVAQRRRFVKPMRLERGDAMLPDFRLTDTTVPTAIEVYGMQGNAQYMARKAEKQALYARERTPCVEWVPPDDLASVRLPDGA